MSVRFSTKLCGRKEPERGCLAKPTCSAPKDKSPILLLPPEIRACIFNYIIGDVDLVYRCAQKFTNFQCVASWSDYNRKLSFLQACKLFQAEAWTLIRVKSATFEKTAGKDFPRSIPDKFGPQQVPLPLSRVRPHLREIRADGNTLRWMLETDFLSTFPRLQRITVFQTHGRERRGTEFRHTLDSPSERQEILQKQLDHIYTHCGPITITGPPDKVVPRRIRTWKHDPRAPLRDILDTVQRETNLPIILEATTEYSDRPSHGTQCVEPVYPVLANVSSVKIGFEWNTRKWVSMDVNMWNQPMEMAVKSKYTESIVLTKDELEGTVTAKPVE